MNSVAGLVLWEVEVDDDEAGNTRPKLLILTEKRDQAEAGRKADEIAKALKQVVVGVRFSGVIDG